MNAFSKVIRALCEGGVSLLFTRALIKARTVVSRRTYVKFYLAHEITHGLPIVDVVFRPVVSEEGDVAIATRILVALRAALISENAVGNVHTGDLWEDIRREQHKDFYAIWDDPVKVAEYMNNMNQRGITHGISASSLAEYTDMLHKPIVRREWGIMVKDILISFAEAVGAMPSKLDGNNFYIDEATILDALEEKIGISLIPSEAEGGMFKLKIRNRYFDYRDLWSAYTAWRIYMLVGADASIAEIGAGMGKVALYAKQYGFKRYTTYDLPLVSAAQAWYLIKSGITVQLYNEKPQPGAVRILPYWEFSDKESFDVTVNADSFPEMDESIVRTYLTTIKKNTKKYFLSINQEDAGAYGVSRHHITVKDVVGDVEGLKLVYRFPFWLRKNYIEELYTV